MERLYRIREVSEQLGCSESFTYRLVADGRLRAFKAPLAEGAKKSIVRVRESELQRFVEENSN